jgi:methionyl-tRNA formyltransferase
MAKGTKIIFMGTPSYATVIFQKLLEENFNILALFTQKDKKVGRKQIITPPHIKQFSKESGLSLPIYQPDTLKNKNITKVIQQLKPDFIIVAAFGQILPKEILTLAPCINLHASLLPLYRGASPIQQSILNDDGFTGVTAMLMDEGLDSGDILGFRYTKIAPTTNSIQLFDKLSISASELIVDILKNYDNIIPQKQNLSQVSFCGKITKNDGKVDFSNAKKLYQKYKAYKFWPQIFLENGLKISECKLNDELSSNKAGEILQISKDDITIGCLVGSIKLIKVQPKSKKIMQVTDYIRGARLGIGDVFC